LEILESNYFLLELEVDQVEKKDPIEKKGGDTARTYQVFSICF
jgi:hypothetical protein